MGHWNALLCGVDFSEPSRHAMLEACHVAKESNARLTLVHVFAPPVSGYAPTELVEPPSPKLLGVVTGGARAQARDLARGGGADHRRGGRRTRAARTAG